MRRRDLSAVLFATGTISAGASPSPSVAIGAERLYPQTSAERSAGVSPVDLTLAPGVVSRYGANLNPGETDMAGALRQATAQALQPGGSPIAVTDHCRIVSDVIVTSHVRLDMESGTLKIDRGRILTINGTFTAPRIECFRGEGLVVFGMGATFAIFPEWFGARGDAAIDGSRGIDSTAAFTAAVASATENGAGTVAIHPISIGPGNFVVGNLRLPPATTMRGTGRQTTNIGCPPSAHGDWWTDTGNAAKITLEDFAMYGNRNPRLTAGLRLGYGSFPHSTEGYLNRLWIRDISKGTALDVLGNVGLYDTITTYNSFTNIRVLGSANMARGLISEGALGSGAGYGVWLGGTNVSSLEIEGMESGTVPLRLDQNVSIQGLWVSFAPSTTIDHVWELGPNATCWSIQNLTYYFSGSVKIAGGNGRRSDGSYFGGNATGSPRGNHDGEGNYSSQTNGQHLQCFVIQILNSEGRLQHKICEANGGAGNFSSLIAGASAQLTITPSEADMTTGFAAGGKIASANPGTFWLDTANQKIADSIGIAAISYNTSGTPLAVNASIQASTIAGQRRNRLAFSLSNLATGALFPLNPSTIGTGKMVQITWQGYLSA
jgi:hypothetical protein